jgi:hypothetical protein
MLGEQFSIEKSIQAQIKKQRAEFAGSDEEFQVLIKDRLPKALKEMTKGIMKETFDYFTSNKTDLKKQERKIKKSIKIKYETAIRWFEAFNELNAKISSSTYNKLYNVLKTKDDDLKLDILSSIHVRACQIANEILVLISNGYADGAHARWRSLHELCVVFLILFDNDYETLEMYVNYEAIESWRKARDYRENYEELNQEPLDEKDWEEIVSLKESMIEKYGKEFSESYGWTMKILPRGRRNFKELEKKVDLDYMRVVYTWASENVHAGASGLNDRLGLREEEQDCFLAGPSDYGFLDPVQYTSISMMEMSLTFLEMEDSIMNSIYSELLKFFQEKLVEEFDKEK